MDKHLNVSTNSDLVFRLLEPRLESGLDVVRKKYQVFLSASELFLSRLQEQLQNDFARPLIGAGRIKKP